VFYQLNAANGLSYNYVNALCIDKSGMLWIATGNGLNMFNGTTVVKFYSNEYPQLRNSVIRHIICDEKNRLWILTDNGNVAMLDEQRQFHKVGLYLNEQFVYTRWILKTKSAGAILFTRKGLFSLNERKVFTVNDSLSINNFSPIRINGFDSLQSASFRQIEPFEDNVYLMVRNDGLYKLNFETLKMEKYDFSGLTYFTKWAPGEILGWNISGQKLMVINLVSQKISYPFENMTDQYGEKVSAYFTNAKKINDDQFLLTTFNSGAYIYNRASKKIYLYRHEAFDNTTLANNRPFHVAFDNTGWIFLSVNGLGVNYFKNNDIIGNQNTFHDASGQSYDGYIIGIATDDNDTYYLGTSDGFIKWKRSTDKSTFLDFIALSKEALKKEEVSALALDDKKRVWIATVTQGIFIIDRNDKFIRHIKVDGTSQNTLRQRTIYHLKLSGDGYMWATGTNGICRISTDNFQVDNFNNTPLSNLNQTGCLSFFAADSANIFVATTGKGVWEYNVVTKKLKVYDKGTGLLSNNIICINKDRFNNLYIGSDYGVNIFLNNGKTKTITTKDGLLSSRAEALLPDKEDRMWIGNDVGLACFNIKDSSVTAFDERYGLSIYGFVINSYYQNSNGEFILSTPRGLQYLYPDDLFRQKINLNATITRIESRNITSSIAENAKFNLSPTDNYVTFYFSSIDYSKKKITFYEYKLEGLDKDWIKVSDQNSVRYSSLPSGDYTFKVRVSNDNKIWKDAKNSVAINVAKPLAERTWFKLLGFAAGLTLIWLVINFYRKKQMEQQEELETQTVINYFASSINSYQRTDDILWDVASNCISKLHFEDCVIYLLDEERNVLVQKAAHGPKMARDFTIHQPIEIPVGQGIVGTVAKTGKAELIGNTELDARYIVDDARRYSEVAVPLIADDKVIGVIDSEHSKKNFFTQRHLTILSTVAVLCANQIQRARAEEEKQKAKIEVLENKQKVAESRLQSLRLQMNPHFLFNALNSIQQMILANEELVATRFLSRFSKLLRTILIHSDKETVTLKEELEILNLYIELEARRFKDSFQYKIECDEEIDEDEIKIPTLLIQPFVENAIWHGLMHKEGNRYLSVHFSETDNYLRCVVEDNGVGRKKSQEEKKANGQDRVHISKGIKVSLERLKTIRNKQGDEGSLIITDLYDENEHATGTRVEINFPIQN
jgi:ligand-binding sensor domain-containing protein/putative methionine-R-sulfoxide reductase with GAF domain/anti-sigma regulatory factor (Ser/Thr protein kinase)